MPGPFKSRREPALPFVAEKGDLLQSDEPPLAQGSQKLGHRNFGFTWMQLMGSGKVADHSIHRPAAVDEIPNLGAESIELELFFKNAVLGCAHSLGQGGKKGPRLMGIDEEEIAGLQP